MPSKVSKKRLSIALVAGTLVAAMVPGLASASTRSGAKLGVGEPVTAVLEFNGAPVAGPNNTWVWGHPDGKPTNPGQAMQYFCFDR